LALDKKGAAINPPASSELCFTNSLRELLEASLCIWLFLKVIVQDSF
jgi:hypothetical protein